MRTLNKGMAARYQQENHVTRYPVILYRSVPATRNDFVNDIVNDARADAIFATLKAIVDDEKSTISSTISLRVAWPLETAKFESSLKMVCILAEMLLEYGVKLAEEMGCRMRGMVKRKLLCSAMSHTGFMVKVTQ